MSIVSLDEGPELVTEKIIYDPHASSKVIYNFQPEIKPDAFLS
jgi:hypothetical protein